LPGYLVDLYTSLKNDSPFFNGDTSWTLPMPGRFVIGQDGIIRYAEVNPDHDRGQRHPGRCGRIPNTAGIGLEQTGVELDARGYIRVNERLETVAHGIWALGECAGSPQFTHVSVDDFRIIVDNLAGGARSTRGRLVPYCVFTDPPLAHVGLSERDAQHAGIAARVARLPMEAVLRAHTTNETLGFMKVLIGSSDDRILGFTMIGSEAGEVMAAVQTAMLAELPYPRLRDAVIAHLTIAEGLGFLLANVAPLVTQPEPRA
jgi:pyruvate/2-oxoglutarate dehydrogenase complex dihydrolipoamide dehydrogenase (E3) component